MTDILEGVQVAEARSQDEEDQPHHVVPFLVNGKMEREKNLNHSEKFALFNTELCCRATSVNARNKRTTITEDGVMPGKKIGANEKASGTDWGFRRQKHLASGVDIAKRVKVLSRQHVNWLP